MVLMTQSDGLPWSPVSGTVVEVMGALEPRCV